MKVHSTARTTIAFEVLEVDCSSPGDPCVTLHGPRRSDSRGLRQIGSAFSAPILALPQPDGQFRVKTNASGYAIGAVLSQQQNEQWHPITFLSHCMTPAEQNYEIYDKELLAIVVALKTW